MSRHMIIADSSQVLEKAVKLALSQYDVTLHTAQNLSELKSKLLASSFDLALIDVGLQDLEKEGQLTAFQHEKTPIIWLLGSYQPLLPIDLDSQGGKKRDVLKKPFSSKELLDKCADLQISLNLKKTQTASSAKPSEKISKPEATEREDAWGASKDPWGGSKESWGGNKEEFMAKILPSIKEEMSELVTGFVQDYCEKHFKAIARDILGDEIRKLAEEKSRLMLE